MYVKDSREIKPPDFGEAIVNAGTRIYNEEQMYRPVPEDTAEAHYRRGLQRARQILREEYEKLA